MTVSDTEARLAAELWLDRLDDADALKVIDDDDITLELKASNKPGLLRAGRDFTYVLMPVTV